jgi:hypothetical protein
VREFFRKLLGHKATRHAATESADAHVGNDDDFGWMSPPNTVVDPGPWDQYWHDQLSHGVAGFVHMFVDDGKLVDAMLANGLKTVLCIGNGVSQEPRALAWAGFDVTAMDLSPLATELARRATPPDDFLKQLVGGKSGGRNGLLEFVVGDVRDSSCCPGPYDVVIDRKTLQLFPGADRATAMQAVANRLASRGIFFSHAHDGSWKPPAPRRHATESWFRTEGWQFWRGGTRLTTRVAWLLTTSG